MLVCVVNLRGVLILELQSQSAGLAVLKERKSEEAQKEQEDREQLHPNAQRSRGRSIMTTTSAPALVIASSVCLAASVRHF